MKISAFASAYFFLSASLASAQDCGEIKVFAYGSSDEPIAEGERDASFTAPVGEFICIVECDWWSGRNVDVYIKYGTDDQDAGPGNYDAKLEGGTCGQTFAAQNSGGEDGIKAYVEADGGFQNLEVKCACPSQLSPLAGGLGLGIDLCFSGDDTVQVLGQGEVLMKDLQVGDKVLTNGKDQYEPIYSFGHYHETQMADFVTMDAGSKDPLSMTPSHLLYVNDESNPIRADNVRVGDNLSSGRVEKVSTVSKQGIFMPLTPSGKIMVNDVEASNYVSMANYAPIQQHPLLHFWMSEDFLVHLWLSPYRLYCMGISSNYCHNYPKNVDGDEGIMGYLLMGEKLAEFALHQSFFVQVLVGIPVLGSLLAVHAVETLAGGPSLAPLMALVGLAVYMKVRESKAKKQKVV